MDHLLEGRWRDHSKFCQICGKESRGTTGLMQITLCNPKPCCWNSCINKKKQKSPSCREMKTVMFYSVYLNVPWIAVLSCVEFNLRGDIFLFKPPPQKRQKTKNKNQQPKLPKISTSQTESGRSWLTGTTMPARVFRNTKLYQWNFFIQMFSPFLTCGAYSCTSRVPAALKISFLKYFNSFLNYPTE